MGCTKMSERVKEVASRASTRHRLSVASRVAAAVPGAYTLTAIMVMLAAQMLLRAGIGPAEAVLAATIPAFLVYAAMVCAVFHARSAARAWAWLAGAAAPIGALLWIMTGPVLR